MARLFLDLDFDKEDPELVDPLELAELIIGYYNDRTNYDHEAKLVNVFWSTTT